MDNFTIKRGDTSPAIRYAISPATITLAGASVRFQMRRSGGATLIDAPASIVSASPPVVEYEWFAGDTSEEGEFEAEFRVVYSDGSVETFPNEGFIPVLISPDVEDLPPTPAGPATYVGRLVNITAAPVAGAQVRIAPDRDAWRVVTGEAVAPAAITLIASGADGLVGTALIPGAYVVTVRLLNGTVLPAFRSVPGAVGDWLQPGDALPDPEGALTFDGDSLVFDGDQLIFTPA